LAEKNLTGPQKAALFILSVGEDFATQVFQRLAEDEIKRLGEIMAEIREVPEGKLIEEVFQEFMDVFEGRRFGTFCGDAFLRRTLQKTWDGNKANSFLEDVQAKKTPRPFERLRQMDPSVLASFIRNEHPQTVALVLAHLSHRAAASILKLLPADMQADVIRRIASLENVPTEVVSDIEEILEQEISTIGDMKQRELGGIQAAAEIMNQLDQNTEKEIMGQIEETQQELADNIRQLMFVFEDLHNIDDRGIRELLKQISNDDLILALKTASEGLKEKIFANLSERAAEMLREDMEIMGPARLSDVEQAQLVVIQAARKLEAEGKIIIAGRGGEDLIV
jgi:flagellar motor switch protein FliG